MCGVRVQLRSTAAVCRGGVEGVSVLLSLLLHHLLLLLLCLGQQHWDVPLSVRGSGQKQLVPHSFP